MKSLILTIFSFGYLAVILEHKLKINKAAMALFMAVTCWGVVLLSEAVPLVRSGLTNLNDHVMSISQILFFLLGAMTIVELIDSHRGFKIITNLIQTQSKRKILWIISFLSFFLSAILDNLTTTILMTSVLRKLVQNRKDRMLLSCFVVVASNAGGAWSPIGDVTTTMLWIEGQLSTPSIIKGLFLPSLVSLLIPLLYFTYRIKGTFLPHSPISETEEPGARLVLGTGIGGLIFVPILKTLTGLPPFMGTLISLSIVWLLTDGLHQQHEQRNHLRVSHIFTKIDISGIFFFLGILLTVGALESANILSDFALWLNLHLKSLPLMATFIGLLSALIDNIPLVAATMGMYPLTEFPMDHPLWLMTAYAAGTGGSLLIIGSSSGIALMGMEKIDFISYTKAVSFPALIGYLAGMGVYLITY